VDEKQRRQEVMGILDSLKYHADFKKKKKEAPSEDIASEVASLEEGEGASVAAVPSPAEASTDVSPASPEDVAPEGYTSEEEGGMPEGPATLDTVMNVGPRKKKRIDETATQPQAITGVQ